MPGSVARIKILLFVLLSTITFSERGYAEQVTVAFSNTVHAESANIDLTFESVSDFRCPADVYCFWEGCAGIKVLVTTDSDTYNVILPIMGTVIEPSGRSLAPIDAFGFRFTLMRLLPYPMVHDTISDSDYEAVIRIEPLPHIGGVNGSVVIANSLCARSGFEVAVNPAYVTERILSMNVSYSGGCFDHYFMLHWDDYQTDSEVDTVYLSLRIDPFEDPCDAIITEQLDFDLTPAIKYYEELAGGPQLVVFSVGGGAVTYDPSSCCSDITGNVDNDINSNIDIADLTFLIDHLFINFPVLDCPQKANIDGDSNGDINIADLTFLIDHLFIDLPPTAACQ